MARGIDFSALTPAERIVGVSGVALFLDGFVPWWFRIHTPAHTYTHNAGLSGWSLAAVVCGFVAAAAVTMHTLRRTRGGQRDTAMYFAVAIAVLAFLAVQAHGRAHEWIGFYFAVACDIGLVVGALRRYRERRSGWA